MKNNRRFWLFLFAIGFLIPVLFLSLWLKSAARAQEIVQFSRAVEAPANNDNLVGWKNAGLYGAHIYEAAFDPKDDQVYLSVAGGAYKSTDGGENWTLISQNGVNGLAVDPVNGTVYVGVNTSNPDSHEIWTSDDGGVNWVKHTGFEALPFTIALDPHDGQAAFVGTNGFDHPLGGKVFRTLNGGDTWQSVTVDLGFCISSVAVDPLNSNRVWAVSGACYGYPDHSAVYLSTNRGQAYNQVFTSSNGYEYTQVAFDPAGNLFLMGDGLRISHNGGVTFSDEMFNETIPWTDNLSLIFDPVTGWAYRQAIGTKYSKDGGDTWLPIDLPRLYAINPENNLNMLAGMLPGLSRTLNGGSTWLNANKGLEHVIVPHLDGSATEPVVYASTHSGFGRSLDGGLTWDFPTGGGTFSLAVDPNTPGKVFTENGHSTFNLSTDYGEHWTSTAIVAENTQITSIAVDPANSNTIYAGLSTLRADPSSTESVSGLYASLDGGSTWNPVGLAGRQVYVIKAATQPTGSLIYVGINYDASGTFDGGLYRGLSGGSTWDLIGFSTSNINDLAVDPSDPSHLFVAIGHYYPTDQPKGLYESHNKGDTWNKVVIEPSNDIAATAVLLDPFDPAIIYVSTITNIYRSRDAGLTWAHFERADNRNFLTLSIPYGEQVRLFAGLAQGAYNRPVGIRDTLDPLTGAALDFSNGLGFEADILDDGGAVTTPTVLGYLDLIQPEVSSLAFRKGIHAFQLDAYRAGDRLANLTFEQPVTITFTYPDMPGLNESSFRLFSWTGTAWQEAACGSYQRDPANNRLVVPVCHTGQFGLFGSPLQVFLPLTRK